MWKLTPCRTEGRGKLCCRWVKQCLGRITSYRTECRRKLCCRRGKQYLVKWVGGVEGEGEEGEERRNVGFVDLTAAFDHNGEPELSRVTVQDWYVKEQQCDSLPDTNDVGLRLGALGKLVVGVAVSGLEIDVEAVSGLGR